MAYCDTFLPGIYEVVPGQPFAVNLDTRVESKLAKIQMSRIQDLFGGRLSFAKSGKAEGPLGQAGIRTPIWGQLLAALLLLILVEGFLAKRV